MGTIEGLEVEHPNGYRVELWNVDPAIAAALLKGNVKNRTLTPRAKDQMRGAMERGEWRLSPDAIHVSDEGRLFNGQKRLTAVLESGVKCPFIVLIGGDQHDQEITDTGQKRIFAHMLQLRGEKNTNLLAAATASVWAYENIGIPLAYKGLASRAPTIPQLFEALDRHPLLRDVTSRRRGVVGIPPGLYVALCYLMLRADEEDANFFYERLADGVELKPGSPILTLRNRLMNEAQKEGHGLNSKVIAAFVVRAWNAWVAGEQLTKLQWKAGGARPNRFPRIAGCPVLVKADTTEDE